MNNNITICRTYSMPEGTPEQTGAVVQTTAPELLTTHEPTTGTAHHVPRTEFGYTRTECACPQCTAHCRVVPGYLVPADLERLSRFLGYRNPLTCAAENLLASPGATVVQQGRVRQLPTLVPRRQANGACIFLDAQQRCRIHAVAPYGCAFFDAHQPEAEADARSQRGLQEIARHWANPKAHLYTLIWRILNATGRCAVPPAWARQQAAQQTQE